MIRFGLRLTVRGGREAMARLVVICAAVAVGVALLLSTLAGLNAVHAQNNRFAWLDTGPTANASGAAAPPGVDPEWWRLRVDEFHGTEIARIEIAATGPHSPVPPGLTHLPAPGEYYASPALATLIRTTPTEQLAARYPGRLAGTIGSAALPSPDTLVVVIGQTPAQLAGQPNADEITAIANVPPDQCNVNCFDVGINANGMDLILSVVTVAILFPVVIFIGAATRLSAARRNQRFAAMRLVGATPRQIAMIAAVESTLAAAIGTALGFGLFFAFRPLVAQVPFTGERFYPGDLGLTWPDVVLVGLGVPLAAAIAARFALRRVIVSPLGVSRRVTPKEPSAWRMLPVLLGLGELIWFVQNGRPASTGGQIAAFMSAILITMSGLVFAGPWLTMVGSRAMARRARRPAALIAARRLSDNPAAGFRAVSGLVLALFVASIAFGIIVTFSSDSGSWSKSTTAQQSTLVDDLTTFSDSGPLATVPSVSPAVIAHVRAVPGVRQVTTLHAIRVTAPAPLPAVTGPGVHTVPPPGGNFPPTELDGLVACSELANAPAIGHCAAGAQVASLPDVGFGGGWTSRSTVTWPTATTTLAALATTPVAAVVVSTDGSHTAIETARSILEQQLPPHDRFAPTTIAEDRSSTADAKRAQGYERLADVVILTSLPIAGCTLAVSVVAGLNDRRRPFGLLRLTGAPLSTLRRVIALEAVVPLLVSAVVSTAVGFAAAYLFLRAQLAETLVPPGWGYYAVVIAGLGASLGIIASTLPLLDRTTATESTRTD